MTTTPAPTTVPFQASLDEHGRLLHEDDPAAQLALCLAGVEAHLATVGLAPSALDALRVTTADHHRIGPVLDVLHERFAQTGARPLVTVREVPQLLPSGLLVLLDGTARPSPPSPETPATNQMETVMTLTPTPTRDLAALVAAAPGRVHLPGDPAYDALRLPWNLSVDQRPAAIGVPTTTAEVVALVRTASRLGLRVAPQSTGHGAAPLHCRLDGTLLLKLHELSGVTIDAAARTARVVGGTQWAPVVHAAAEHGLTAPHGSAPDVGVVGYTLSGGLSFYGRRHGLAVNHVRAVELVTPDGRLVRCSATEEPELFWAVRGAGGNLGVVVALEIELLSYADVHAGMLLWDGTHTEEVVRAWSSWTRALPESVTTSLRVMSFPPLPELPPFLSGRRVVVVDGAVLEDEASASALLAPLRALSPEMDTFGRIPTPALLGVHMDPPAPSPAVTTHAVLGPLDEHAVDRLLEVVTAPSPLLFTELRHVGGAFARTVPGGGALGHLDGEYVLHCAAITPTPEAVLAAGAAGDAAVAAMAPWRVAGRALTFSEEREPVVERAAEAFSAVDWQRLRAVRRGVDPTGTMQATVDVG